MKVYFAGPLFTLTERKVNRALAEYVANSVPGIEVLLPQDFKPEDSDEFEHGTLDCKAIFVDCAGGVVSADIMVANLDGCDSDSGTCWEVGYAYALKKPIIGVRTDYRPNQDGGLNIMLARCCTKVIHHLAFDENVNALARDVSRAIKALRQKAGGLKEAPQPASKADGKKLYWAGPLFTLTERKTNRALAEALKKSIPALEIHLPQDFKNGGKFNDRRAFGAIFKSNVEHIDSANLMVAVLDGCDTDTGTSWEVGYAYGKGKPVIGVRTDNREQQEKGLNIMLSRGCTSLVHRPDFDENLGALVKQIVAAVKSVIPGSGSESRKKSSKRAQNRRSRKRG